MKQNTKEVQLTLGGYRIKINIHKREGTDHSSFEGIELVSDNVVVLKFATPQFKANPVLRVPAVLVKHFKGLATVHEDIQAAGYGDIKLPRGGEEPREQKLPQGHLYSWTTPTAGSADFYYLQNPLDKENALKIGPFPGLVGRDFSFDWAGAQWTKAPV